MKTRRSSEPLSLRLAVRLLPKEVREEVLGDLIEYWHLRVRGKPWYVRLAWTWHHPVRVLFDRLRYGGGTGGRRMSAAGGGFGLLRESARSLARSPVFTVASATSVGLAIGLACSVYAVIQASVLAPLPYAEPDRLVEMWQTARPGSSQRQDRLQPRRMEEWAGAADLRSLESVAGTGIGDPLVMTGPDGPIRVTVHPVLGDWFETMGVPAARGRVLLPDDLDPGAERAAVVSDAFWRDRLSEQFKTIRLSDITYSVVGVMPRSFASGEQVWMPAETLPLEVKPVAYVGVGRLREGATLADAVTEIEQMAAAQVAADSALFGGVGATAQRLRAQGGGPNRQTLWMLTGVVVAVLLVGLSNLTTLMLVRAQARSQALAIRASVVTPAMLICA